MVSSEERLEQLARLAFHRRTRRALLRAAGSLIAVLATRFPSLQGAGTGSYPCPATTAEEAEAVAKASFAASMRATRTRSARCWPRTIVITERVVTDQDRALHQERLRINRRAFPGGHYELVDMFAQGDLVAVRHIFTGTLQDAYAGVEPAGQPVAVPSASIFTGWPAAGSWRPGTPGTLSVCCARSARCHRRDRRRARPSRQSRLQVVASPVASDCPPGTAEENAAIGRLWTEDALDGHNLDLLDEFVAEDLVHHAGLFVDEIGREALKADLAALIEAFPDIRFTADVVVASADRAAVRWTGRGTHQGEFQGLAPTGLPVVFTGINVYRIACGQIVEGWSEPDALGLLQQLGVVPEIAPSPATPTG